MDGRTDIVDENSADWLVVVGWLQPVRGSVLQFLGLSEEGANVAQTSLPLLVCSHHSSRGLSLVP